MLKTTHTSKIYNHYRYRIICDNMKLYKSFIFIIILVAFLCTSIAFANDNATLEEHDFDSHFKMNVPKGITFEKTEGTPSKSINLTVNYRNETSKINIVYTESAGAKDDLLKYYENFSRNDPDITFNSTNNTTIIHFNGENIIGETNYHDLAIVGDDTKYILIQCDNESLMKSMVKSIKFE